LVSSCGIASACQQETTRTAAAPEPDTGALLLGSVGLLSGLMRRCATAGRLSLRRTFAFMLPMAALSLAMPAWAESLRVERAPAQLVSFYSGANDGGMEVFFSPVEPGVLNYQSIGTLGAAYYSGSELTPRIEPGSYATFHPGFTGIYVVDFENKYWQPATVVTISAVPEPAAWALMFAGVGVLLVRRSFATRPR
jgi:hypothetical protein